MHGKLAPIACALAGVLVVGVAMAAPAPAAEHAKIQNISASASATVIEPDGGGVTITAKGPFDGIPVLQYRNLVSDDPETWVTLTKLTKRGKTWDAAISTPAPGDYLYRVIAKSGTKTLGVSAPISVKKFGWFPSESGDTDPPVDFAGTALPAGHGPTFNDLPVVLASGQYGCTALDFGVKTSGAAFGTIKPDDAATLTITSDASPPLVVTVNAANPVVLMRGIPVSGTISLAKHVTPYVSVLVGVLLKCLGQVPHGTNMTGGR